MIDWELIEKGYDKEKISAHGNKFLVGNGYMGVRGTLDEYDKSNLVAVNLAGIYDQVGDAWREPVNAPNGFYGYLMVDGEKISLPEIEAKYHCLRLDYRHGILKRQTEWKLPRGTVKINVERFVSMDDVHIGAIKCGITTDFHADIKYVTGIDADVWDINGPHYDAITISSDEFLSVDTITHEKKHKVSVAEVVLADFPSHKKVESQDNKALQSIEFVTEVNKTYEVTRIFSVYTSKDVNDSHGAAEFSVSSAQKMGYEELLKKHIEKWEQLWDLSEVVIEGDDKAMEALNYSIYHLHCIAPRHSDSLSIAARGLSGQTYKGAVFWDTEMFMMDFFLMTEPKVARNLIKYRIDTLEGAIEKAKGYGLTGAFYAWESQEGGYDACSDYNVTDVFTGRPLRTFFKDKQIHISSAVVYGIGRYMDMTGDVTLLSDGGAKTIIECARFYYGLLLKKIDSKYYELHDVIGPDEYHERVNNNGYTNRMAKYTFGQALKVIEGIGELSEEVRNELEGEYNFDKLKADFLDAYNNIFIPQANEEGVIPQFDGYLDLEDVSVDEVRSRILDPKEYWGGAYGVATHTQVIKQADVVTWLNIFPEDVSDEIKLKNWEYYEPRTEHGSSLSACMYAMLACKCGMKEKAYPLFMKSASADLVGGGKEWAGLVYIGGTHPASEGGAYMVAINGFAGVSCNNGQIEVNPKLPDNWKKMNFKIRYQDKLYKIQIEGSDTVIEKID